MCLSSIWNFTFYFDLTVQVIIQFSLYIFHLMKLFIIHFSFNLMCYLLWTIRISCHYLFDKLSFCMSVGGVWYTALSLFFLSPDTWKFIGFFFYSRLISIVLFIQVKKIQRYSFDNVLYFLEQHYKNTFFVKYVDVVNYLVGALFNVASIYTLVTVGIEVTLILVSKFLSVAWTQI